MAKINVYKNSKFKIRKRENVEIKEILHKLLRR